MATIVICTAAHWRSPIEHGYRASKHELLEIGRGQAVVAVPVVGERGDERWFLIKKLVGSAKSCRIRGYLADAVGIRILPSLSRQRENLNQVLPAAGVACFSL